MCASLKSSNELLFSNSWVFFPKQYNSFLKTITLQQTPKKPKRHFYEPYRLLQNEVYLIHREA